MNNKEFLDKSRGEWFVHINDLIGGWSVNNVDKPISQCDASKGEWEIADFCAEEHAREIARLHNNTLDI